MPYTISKSDLDALGAALTEYYEAAWQQGVKDLFDKMARSQMGIVTGYLDVAKDTYAGLKKESADKFWTTFRPALKQYVGVYLANKSDVVSDLVLVAEKALSSLASHIPHGGGIVSAAISFAGGKGREELHLRSIKEADGQLAAKTGESAGKLFTNDVEAAAAAQKAIDQYKLICKYIQTLPANITTFNDAVTFPASVFRVQKAASSLNVALLSIGEYIAGMQDRLIRIQEVSKEYITKVRQDMPAAANSVLQHGYDGAYKKGEADIAKKKYSCPATPSFRRPDKPGAATQLAAFLANAVAQGYYDSGNRGPLIAKPHPMGIPPRPSYPPPPPPLPPRPKR